MERKIPAVLEEIGRTASRFVDLFSEYLSLIFQEVIKNGKITGKEITIPHVPSLEDIRLHYFVREPE